jgi:hypothetical protein
LREFLEDTIALLERTPPAMRTLLDGLPDGWLGEPDAAGGVVEGGCAGVLAARG